MAVAHLPPLQQQKLQKLRQWQTSAQNAQQQLKQEVKNDE
jgi:hypothetical protein